MYVLWCRNRRKLLGLAQTKLSLESTELSLSTYVCRFFTLSLPPPPFRHPQLLEQALAVEEQLHRASNAGLVQDPNHSVMQLHSRYTDLDCLADGHVPLVAECLKHKKNSILLMKKGSILLFQLCISSILFIQFCELGEKIWSSYVTL